MKFRFHREFHSIPSSDDFIAVSLAGIRRTREFNLQFKLSVNTRRIKHEKSVFPFVVGANKDFIVIGWEFARAWVTGRRLCRDPKINFPNRRKTQIENAFPLHTLDISRPRPRRCEWRRKLAAQRKHLFWHSHTHSCTCDVAMWENSFLVDCSRWSMG